MLKMITNNQRNIIRFVTGGSFLLTPLLIITMLLCKDQYFTLLAQNKYINNNIVDERIKTANLALQFARNQNHQKILDLQTKYLSQYRYIQSEDIINEEEIEFL
ncbi:MAG: hypothetical protein ACI9CD_000129 [Candidatus Deianiraeaceae bacterium]|jgi:hypothetical protein